MTFRILNSDIQEPLSIAAYVHFTHPAIYSYYLIHWRYTAECNRCVLTKCSYFHYNYGPHLQVGTYKPLSTDIVLMFSMSICETTDICTSSPNRPINTRLPHALQTAPFTYLKALSRSRSAKMSSGAGCAGASRWVPTGSGG
jgi:hypothetical protein